MSYCWKQSAVFQHSVSKHLVLCTENYNPEQRSWLLATYRRLCILGRNLGEAIEADGPTEPINEVVLSQDAPHSSPSQNQQNPEKQEEYLECRRLSAYNFPVSVLFLSG